MKTKPYYQNDWITLYRGDAGDILGELYDAKVTVDAVITDPVWPNYIKEILLPGSTPEGLFSVAAGHFLKMATRVAVVLGIKSDPVALLKYISGSMPYFRSVFLEFIKFTCNGRTLINGDVAFLYGDPPLSRGRKVNMIIPGRIQSREKNDKFNPHPCPRKLEHITGLVKWWSNPGEIILDPFVGSGITAVACMHMGRKCIGIDINEGYLRYAIKRIRDVEKRLFPVLEVV